LFSSALSKLSRHVDFEEIHASGAIAYGPHRNNCSDTVQPRAGRILFKDEDLPESLDIACPGPQVYVTGGCGESYLPLCTLAPGFDTQQPTIQPEVTIDHRRGTEACSGGRPAGSDRYLQRARSRFVIERIYICGARAAHLGHRRPVRSNHATTACLRLGYRPSESLFERREQERVRGRIQRTQIFFGGANQFDC
jgi:hypothetical protein